MDGYMEWFDCDIVAEKTTKTKYIALHAGGGNYYLVTYRVTEGENCDEPLDEPLDIEKITRGRAKALYRRKDFTTSYYDYLFS